MINPATGMNLSARSLKKIMIVEDDVDLRETLVDFFTEVGFKAKAFSNGESALYQLAAHGPDLIFLDGSLPEMTGYEFLQKVRACPEHRELPIILMSAQPVAGEQKDYLWTHFLPKPISLDDLVVLTGWYLKV